MIGAREEAARKAIHVLASLGAAAVVLWLPPIHAAIALAAATTVALTVELARRSSRGVGRVFHRRLGWLLREGEETRLTGATTLAIGYTIPAVLFPGLPTVAAILVAGVADAVAAVVGKRFGRVRYPGGKSVEGSLAFLAVVFLVMLGFRELAWAPALAAAAALTLVEAPTLRVDDNLYLPLAAAAGSVLAGLAPAPIFFS